MTRTQPRTGPLAGSRPGHDGTTRWARVRRQARATGMMAALAARQVPGLPPAVHHLHRVATLGDVPRSTAIALARAA